MLVIKGSDGGTRGGSPNLQVWTSELVAELYQKKHQEWFLLIYLTTL